MSASMVRGATLLLVTHQIGAIIPEISRCVLLRQGRVVGDGSSADLLQATPSAPCLKHP